MLLKKQYIICSIIIFAFMLPGCTSTVSNDTIHHDSVKKTHSQEHSTVLTKPNAANFAAGTMIGATIAFLTPFVVGVLLI